MGQMQTAEELKQLTPKQLKRTLGRPTKYNSTVLVDSINYLSTYKELGQIVPSKAGLAIALGLDRGTVADWASHEDKPEFSRIVRALEAQQELDALNGGLSGELHPKVVALVLSKHGYHEAPEAATGVSITVNVDRTCGGVVVDGQVIDELGKD
ncbi:MAG: hypothetical protein GWN00_19990 [Aliifodinibius sp.]|nr:hypothetical protein [Fodinibius sp.]NIY27003.1 hypothetical protein [Fodinibius sp.]